jgi:hypothetical protein
VALSQQTPISDPAQSGLRSVPDPRSIPYPASNVPSRLTAGIVGLVAVLVGAWGGIAPYVGHAIHYSADGSATWTWNLHHALLSLLPGAIAVVGGLLLMASAWVRREQPSALRAIGLGVAAVLLGLGAVWFLIGAFVWPIYFTSNALATASPIRTFADVVGYYVAEGLVLAAMAGVVGSWAVRSLPRRSVPAIG